MMKKMMSWGMGLLLLASCSQNEDVPMAIHEAENIRATVPCFEMGTAATRALTLDEQKGLTFIWSEGDVVGVFSKAEKQQIAIYMNSEAGKQTATFSSKGYLLSKGGQYKAYYPIVDKATAEPIIPVDYTGQQQSGNNGYSHLSAKDWIVTDVVTPTATNQADFMFQHVGVILRLIIDMPSAGNWSKLTLSTDDKVFTTKQNLDLFGENLIVPTEQTNSVSLALNDVTTTEDNKKLTAWMMLSPVDFTSRSMTVTVSPETGDDVVFTITPGKNFVSGKAYSINFSNVDHSKNPLLKWAESDLIRSGSGATVSATFADAYTTTGYYYQFGRNYGYQSASDAAQQYGVERSDMPSNRNVYPGTGSTTAVPTYHASSITFSTYPNYFFIDTNHGGDYTTPQRNEEWSTRAKNNGYTYESPCPTGWRIPTIADYKEIMPVINDKAGNSGDEAWNTLVQLKTLADGTKCAFRWSKATIGSYSYLKVECLVVATNVSETSAINWNDTHVVSRYFKGAGSIQANRYNIGNQTSSQYVARPLEWGQYSYYQSGQVVVLQQQKSLMNLGGFYWTSDATQGVFTFVFDSSTGYTLGYYLTTYDRPIAVNIRCIKDNQ